MDPTKTALILIGFQNDYFSPNGALHKAIEFSSEHVLTNTLDLLKQLAPTPITLISTPIVFTPDYEELLNPVGILKLIRDHGAFKAGTTGSSVIEAFRQFDQRIVEISGKRGLNAFFETGLDGYLREHDIVDLVLAGVVTSLCIDSTGRSAFERGYRVSVLSDCTGGRTALEQEFYCQDIFPMYASVMDRHQFMSQLG